MKETLRSSTPKPGTLFICGSPIGNINDATFRLISTLDSVDSIYAEDTRIAQQLCQTYNIKTPLISLQQFNESKRIESIIVKLKSGQSLALISDAGTPTISDPGGRLVQALHHEKIPISPVPGASAITTLFSVSGITTTPFIFIGFYPRNPIEGTRLYNQLQDIQLPIICFESPNRLLKTLRLFQSIDPLSTLILGKELTKKYERIFRGTPTELLNELTNSNHTIKGEWTIIISPVKQRQTHNTHQIIQTLKESGITRTQAQHIAQKLFQISKKTVYEAYLDH